MSWAAIELTWYRPSSSQLFVSHWWCQQQFWTNVLGLGLGPNQTVSKLPVQVVKKQEQWIRIQLNGSLPTFLNSVGHQQVVQQIYCWIHIMLLFLLLDNSKLQKSLIQHQEITFCIVWSLWYRLFSNLCFSLYILHFGLSWGSIVQWWSQLSAQCPDYAICKTKKLLMLCWCPFWWWGNEDIMHCCSRWGGHDFRHKLLIQSEI